MRAPPRPRARRRQRKCHAPEHPPRPCAERSRRRGERRVDRLERGDGGPEVEGARDEGDREDDRDLGEGDVDPERLDRPAEKTEPAEGREEADPGNRGRQHERELDRGDDEVPEAATAGRDPVRGGSPEQDDERHRDRVRLERDDERVLRRVRTERGDQVARGGRAGRSRRPAGRGMPARRSSRRRASRGTEALRR